MRRRIIVAMSGGVDSSVAAALLAERGHEVLGVGLRFPDVPDSAARSSCCGMAGMEDARAVAGELGIPFYVLDYRDAFDEAVIAPFCEAYASGETPNPCIPCNTELKFGRLLALARALGVDHVATGHYARVESDGRTGAPRLWRGLDKAHDQSYFLYSLTREQLAYALFPVGEMTKVQVREVARRQGLDVAAKPSSQDICFVGEEGYRALVAAREPAGAEPGPILDARGHTLGTHQGLAGYTVGQRRGLGIAAAEPLYVTGLDPERNAVLVGPRAETRTRSVRVGKVHWLGDVCPANAIVLDVQTRYRTAAVTATLQWNGDVADVEFAEPQPRVAAGQAVVFYEDDRVLGGGIAQAVSTAAY